jgi:hypothetical protein
VPFALGAAVGAVAIGRVPVGNAAGDPVTSWANPVGILIGVMAVAIVAYISAVFLCADAIDAGHAELATAFRARAIGSAIVAGALAISGLAVIHHDTPRLFTISPMIGASPWSSRRPALACSPSGCSPVGRFILPGTPPAEPTRPQP